MRPLSPYTITIIRFVIPPFSILILQGVQERGTRPSGLRDKLRELLQALRPAGLHSSQHLRGDRREANGAGFDHELCLAVLLLEGDVVSDSSSGLPAASSATALKTRRSGGT